MLHTSNKFTKHSLGRRGGVVVSQRGLTSGSVFVKNKFNYYRACVDVFYSTYS